MGYIIYIAPITMWQRPAGDKVAIYIEKYPEIKNKINTGDIIVTNNCLKFVATGTKTVKELGKWDFVPEIRQADGTFTSPLGYKSLTVSPEVTRLIENPITFYRGVYPQTNGMVVKLDPVVHDAIIGAANGNVYFDDDAVSISYTPSLHKLEYYFKKDSNCVVSSWSVQ